LFFPRATINLINRKIKVHEKEHSGSTRKEEDRIGLDGEQKEMVRTTSDLSDCAK
jgi:hypothetical protein